MVATLNDGMHLSPSTLCIYYVHFIQVTCTVLAINTYFAICIGSTWLAYNSQLPFCFSTTIEKEEAFLCIVVATQSHSTDKLAREGHTMITFKLMKGESSFKLKVCIKFVSNAVPNQKKI